MAQSDTVNDTNGRNWNPVAARELSRLTYARRRVRRHLQDMNERMPSETWDAETTGELIGFAQHVLGLHGGSIVVNWGGNTK